jgi:hypothetical protein
MTLNLPEPQTPERTPAVTAATVPRHRHLTPAMRDALRAARSQPLRRVHKPGPGRPPWPAPAASLAALVRRELVTRGAEVSRKGFRMDVWTITDAGVEALRPPHVVRQRRSLYLAEGWPDYTSDIGRAMRGEPEVMQREAA